MTKASTTATRPTCMEARAPYTMRESWSRPRSSVPSQWAQLGSASTFPKLGCAGSYGAISGARSAARTKTAAMMPPVRASRFLRRARSRPLLGRFLAASAVVGSAVVAVVTGHLRAGCAGR